MRKKILSLLALLLTAAMLFSGCTLGDLAAELEIFTAVPYGQMEYTRPDMEQLAQIREESCAAVASAKNTEKALNAVFAFYEVYDNFYTNYFLADIRYSGDLTDLFWEEEYQFCMENAAQADAALDALYNAIGVSPLKDALEEKYFGRGFFDGYTGESVWDEGFLALMEEEAALQNRYYALSDQAQESEYYSEEYFTIYGTRMAELFVELVALRQEIAEYMGYDSYPQFAYDFYHYRSYTPEETESYLERIGDILVPLYREAAQSEIWEQMGAYCSEDEAFQYVKKAASAMGGQVGRAFRLLEHAGLYDIAYGENKYNIAFETYLWSYAEPFVFVAPYLDQSDKLTFAHEFGHFCADYVSRGSNAGVDVSEVLSQGFEYLSLCYNEDQQLLGQFKLVDSLCVYVEQAAYALFETRVYGLEGEELTPENVEALYRQIGETFGLDCWAWDSRDYVAIPHFYTNPMYIISYVVSNDVAMQLYEKELEKTGRGLAFYENCLTSQESCIIAFADAYGLESPFGEGRLEKVYNLFEAAISGS